MTTSPIPPRRSGRRPIHWLPLALALMVLILMAGCDSSGGDSEAWINGTAAEGAPLAGAVSVRGAEGVRSAGIGADGRFSVSVTGLDGPYLVWAEEAGTADRFYGYHDLTAQAPDRVNLTPLTHAVMAVALKADPSIYYGASPSAPPPAAAAVAAAHQVIAEALFPAFPDLGVPSGFNMLRDEFEADGTGFDRVLELVRVEISDDAVRLLGRATGIEFFACDLATGSVSGWGAEIRRRIILADACSVEFENWYVYTLLKDIYLWADALPDVDPADYDSPEALLDALRYPELDRFSYIAPAEEIENFFGEGRYLGLGVGLKWDAAEDLRVSLVYPDSPADGAGLARGDRVLAIDGIDVRDGGGDWGAILDFTAPGQTVTLTVQGADGAAREATITSDWVEVTAVYEYEIFQHAGMNVGYLVYTDFLDKSKQALDAAFAAFAEAGIDTLVLDLRYNPGGQTGVTVYLASLMAGGRAETGDVFARLIHNDRYSSVNATLNFQQVGERPAPVRIYALTSGRTASASELLINGLRPYGDVVLVGTPTLGKPVGMYGFKFCDQYIVPITFALENALGEGNYFEGLWPECLAADDLDRELGDPAENLLATALFHAETGACPVAGRMAPSVFREEPSRSGLGRRIGTF